MAILPLTTLENAKAYLGSSGAGVAWSPTAEGVASKMILAISQSFENYSSHGFLLSAEPEKRIIHSDFLWCYRWPVASITSVQESRSGRQADLQTLSPDRYEIAPNGKGICVWDVEPGSLVSYLYTGGLAQDTADLISKYPDLEDLCLLQFAAEWSRHNRPDRSGLDLGSTGNITWNGEIKLLSHVEMRLDQDYVSQADFLA